MSELFNEVLMQLFVHGPTWDGNLISKNERDELVRDGFCERACGWNYLTREGVIQAASVGYKTKDWADDTWYKKARMCPVRNGIQIIGITGKKRSGKDTFAQPLIQNGFTRFAFADPVKEVARVMFGVPVDADPSDPAPYFPSVDARYIWQKVGTEASRDVFHQRVWIHNLHQRVLDSGKKRIVITDVRFDDEAEWIRSQGGVLVHVFRIAAENSGDTHRSENGVSTEFITHSVANNSTIENLHNEALELLK